MGDREGGREGGEEGGRRGEAARQKGKDHLRLIHYTLCKGRKRRERKSKERKKKKREAGAEVGREGRWGKCGRGRRVCARSHEPLFPFSACVCATRLCVFRATE